MPEKVAPGPVSDDRCIREAVCIHTKKIFDSCKDEDIALYKQIFFCLSAFAAARAMIAPPPGS